MSGVFIITVDTDEHMLHLGSSQVPNFQLNADLQDTPFPRLAGCQVLPFCDFLDLEIVMCLQMTNSRLYLVSRPMVIATHRHMVYEFQKHAEMLGLGGNDDTDPDLDVVTAIEELHYGITPQIPGECPYRSH